MIAERNGGGMREEDDDARTVDSWMFSPSAVSRMRHVKGCIKRSSGPWHSGARREGQSPLVA